MHQWAISNLPYYGVLANGSVKNKTVLISGGAGAVGFYGIQKTININSQILLD